MARTEPRRWWRYGRALAVPVLLWVLVVAALRDPLRTWLGGEDSYDTGVLQEWLEEARGFRETLPEMVDSYLAWVDRAQALARDADAADGGRLDQRVKARQRVAVKREELHEYLQTLGDPPTKMFVGLLPLFPIVYRLEVRFDQSAVAEPGVDDPLAPVVWDSGLPSQASQCQELEHRLHARATVYLRYQLHAYNKRQRIEKEHNARLQQLAGLAAAATVLGGAWVVVVQRRERERLRQRAEAQRQVGEAERLLLQEERRHAETERKLLEQRLATQAAEQQALELKSQVYASIGIMAGSYAHNIKNLLVRPNDLLQRCLEITDLRPDQEHMLREVRETLGTVTERLQQILRTVRRAPGRSEQAVVDLNEVVRDLERTWKDLARDKWKLELVLELDPAADGKDPLTVIGDVSHLQQAVENLLFNARDATFEMRSHLREAARKAEGLDDAGRRQALIAAAAWKGRVAIRTMRRGKEVILEVADNGAGMTEEVRRRCMEAHFSTKRDRAIYEGNSTGMGLGLSFVGAILENHRARLEIESEPLNGATFRARFPAGEEPPGPRA